MGKASYREHWHAQIREFHDYIELKLLLRKAFKLQGNTNPVDMTRGVGILRTSTSVPTFCTSPEDEQSPVRGIQRALAVSDHADCLVFIFFDMDPDQDRPLAKENEASRGRFTPSRAS